MRINRCILGACLLAFVLAGCSGKEASGETEVSSENVESVETGEPANDTVQSADGCSLSQMYADNFPIGVALPNHVLKDVDKYETVISSNFNIITCENETKPEALLDQKASQEGLPGTYEKPRVHFEQCQPAIDYALEHDMKLRLHTLV